MLHPLCVLREIVFRGLDFWVQGVCGVQIVGQKEHMAGANGFFPVHHFFQIALQGLQLAAVDFNHFLALFARQIFLHFLCVFGQIFTEIRIGAVHGAPARR